MRGFFVALLSLGAVALVGFIALREPLPSDEDESLLLEAGLDAAVDAPPVPTDEPPDEPAGAVITIVPDGQWDSRLDEPTDAPPLPGDPRLARAPEVVGDAGGRMWVPSGRTVLAILERELRGTLQVHFRSTAAREAFEGLTWKQELPARLPLTLLIESCHDVGFRPVLREEGLYLVDSKEP